MLVVDVRQRTKLSSTRQTELEIKSTTMNGQYNRKKAIEVP